MNSDVDALKATLGDVISLVDQKADKYIVTTVSEKTNINTSDIRNLNGNFTGLESRVGNLEGNLKTTIQTFDSKIAADIKAGIDKIVNGGEGTDLKDLVKQEVTNNTFTREQIKEQIKTESDNRVREYERLNNEQFQRIDQRLNDTNNKIDNKNFPSVSDIAVAVAGLDIVRQIFTNTNRPPTLTCQAPALVPPVSAKVTAVNGAVVGLQGVTVTQTTAIKNTLSNPATGLPGINTALAHPQTGLGAIKNVLTHSEYGLQKIQRFADTAWKATKADKVMNALTTAVVIHNAFMLSSNLATTISEATNVALDALGITDESSNPINIGAAVRGKIEEVLTSIIGAESYKALTTRIAAASRVYQASANVYNLVREIGDTTRSITEVACENTGKIGNALLESGVVFENAYDQMIDSVNPQSKAQLKLEKFRNGAEILENAAEAISSISSDVIELQEIRQELTEGKTQLDAAREEFKTAMEDKKTERKRESQADTEVKKEDFGKNERDII
ncbi:MAG: hypothetical protein ACRC2S_10580 [Waterburya sp.]